MHTCAAAWFAFAPGLAKDNPSKILAGNFRWTNKTKGFNLSDGDDDVIGSSLAAGLCRQGEL